MSDDIENCIFISTNVYLLSAEWENAIIEKSEEKQKSNTENEEKYRKGRMNMELEPVQKPEFYPFIESIPNVIECNCVTGDYSMLLEVQFKSTDELDQFIGELQVYGRTKTLIVFSTSVEHREVAVQ